MGIINRALTKSREIGTKTVEKVKKGKDACKNIKSGSKQKFDNLYEAVQDAIDNGTSAVLTIKDWCSHAIAMTLLAKDPKAKIPNRRPTHKKAQEKEKRLLKRKIEGEISLKDRLSYTLFDMSEKKFEKTRIQTVDVIKTFQEKKNELGLSGFYNLNFFQELEKTDYNSFEANGYEFRIKNETAVTEITVINEKGKKVIISFGEKGIMVKDSRGKEIFDSTIDGKSDIMTKIGLFLKIINDHIKTVTKKLPRIAKRKASKDKRNKRLTKMDERESRAKKFKKTRESFLSSF